MRRLQLTVSGRWYVAMTIALGVVALMSGNNVLYLIESLLLSGLILSGVLSERTVAGVDIHLVRSPAIAGETCRDKIKITNRTRRPLFSVEVGEWRDGKFHAIAYVPKLEAKSQQILFSRQTFERRGLHRWEGVAVATRYPFGFARKIKLEKSPGERLVWPPRMGSGRRALQNNSSGSGVRAGLDIADAEVRAMTPDDDWRLIVWTLSARGGAPLVRVRKSESESPEVLLDVRTSPGERFEKLVQHVAQPFYSAGADAASGSLTIVEETGKRRVHGRVHALNELARIKAQGSPPGNGEEERSA